MSLKKGKFQHNQSISLWNYTLSPGWREEEVKILKSALQLFGVGKWRKIVESGCLPGKSIGQIYMQTQRLLGQQSLGDFMGLQIDLQAVFNENMKKQDVLRKNNCIINTGDNPTKEERKRRIEKHRKMYGLSAAQIRDIRLPRVKKDAPEYMTLEDIENEKFNNLEILTHLYNLRNEIQSRLDAMENSEKQTSSGNEHFNQNSNASTSSELIMTLEQSGRKKYKILSVEESQTCPLPVKKSIAKKKEAPVVSKRTTRSASRKNESDDENTQSEQSRSSASQEKDSQIEEEEEEEEEGEEEQEEQEKDEEDNDDDEEEGVEESDEDFASESD